MNDWKKHKDISDKDVKDVLTGIILVAIITIVLARLRAFAPLVDIVCLMTDSETSPAVRQSMGLALTFIAGTLLLLALFAPRDEKGRIK